MAFGDWDADGDTDIIINGRNAGVLENMGEEAESKTVSFTYNGNLSDKKLAGHTTSPTLVNWDNEGKPDLLLGAEDGYFYYWKND